MRDDMKITDAKVDRNNRLHVTFKSGDREFVTAVCEGVQYQPPTISSRDIRIDRSVIKADGALEPGSFLFSIIKQPIISNRRPKTKKAAPSRRKARPKS